MTASTKQGPLINHGPHKLPLLVLHYASEVRLPKPTTGELLVDDQLLYEQAEVDRAIDTFKRSSRTLNGVAMRQLSVALQEAAPSRVL